MFVCDFGVDTTLGGVKSAPDEFPRFTFLSSLPVRPYAARFKVSEVLFVGELCCLNSVIMLSVRFDSRVRYSFVRFWTDFACVVRNNSWNEFGLNKF